MPRPARRAKSRRTGHDENMIDHLRTGSCMSCMIQPPTHDDDDVRAAWEELKHLVLPEYIREHPGCRPWAWWKFDAPAPGRRERCDGRVHPHDNKARSLHVAKTDNPNFWRQAYNLNFGLPSAHIMPFDKDLKTECFEGEWEFLVRNNLLLPEDSP